MTNERFSEMQADALEHYQRTVVQVEESARRLQHYATEAAKASVVLLMNEIEAGALHDCGNNVAWIDFKPAPIVDVVRIDGSLPGGDVWGDAR